MLSLKVKQKKNGLKVKQTKNELKGKQTTKYEKTMIPLLQNPQVKNKKSITYCGGKKTFFSPYIDIEMQALNSLVKKTWIEQTLQLSNSTFFALMNFSVPFVNKVTYVIYNGQQTVILYC